MPTLFRAGTPIFHPIHGAGLVREIARKIILSEEKQYYVIELPFNELHEVMVPVDKAENVGLRPLTAPDRLERVFKILRNDDQTDEISLVKSFYQRYREYVAKLQSGDILEVALVYKLLHLRNLIKPLGMKDKNLLEMAEHLLVSEMVFSLKLSREVVMERLGESLKQGTPPTSGLASPLTEKIEKQGATSG